MSLFEKHLGRKMKDSEKEEEIEFYVRRILTKEQLESRHRFLYRNNKPKQLTLEL